MFPTMALWLKLLLAAAAAYLICYWTTPAVKRFAEKHGILDTPRDGRRVHNHPIPRMGGLAIFLGLVSSLLLFEAQTGQIRGLLLGAVLIAAMGAVDDLVELGPWSKLAVQLLAGLVAVHSGIVFDAVSNPNFLSPTATLPLGVLSVPLTLLWIVGCTNAVNLIDGLDGLAVGVSAISSFTMLIVAIFVADPATAILMAALTGACLGFVPYNANPAQIFMGDLGSQLLGYVLAVASVMGMFKFHAVITFLVPLLALAVPLFDTASAFFRRILHGQSPFTADRKHLHHRLLAMGLDQKQAVAVLYGVSAVLGLFAVLLSNSNVTMRVICLVCAVVISLSAWVFIFPHELPLHRSRPERRSK